VWHTAQSGRHANEKQREFVDLVQHSRLAEMVKGKPRMAAGSMALKLINGSTLKPHPPLHDSLHGEQGDHNDIDEGWSFDEVHGAALFQAIGPTHATRPGAQTFVWSTRGDAASTWFHNLIDRGYAGAGVALFDWGIPYDGDPEDLDLIERHHPAIGHTIEREFLESERQAMPDPAEFARAYGNVPTGGLGDDHPREGVERRPHPRPAAGRAADVRRRRVPRRRPRRPGRRRPRPARPAVAGGDRAAPRPVVADRPHQGTQRLRRGVAIDRRGPAGAVADALELAGVPLLTPTVIDYAAGCQDLYDRVTDPPGRG
jgi:hypothetical protein